MAGVSSPLNSSLSREYQYNNCYTSPSAILYWKYIDADVRSVFCAGRSIAGPIVCAVDSRGDVASRSLVIAYSATAPPRPFWRAVMHGIVLQGLSRTSLSTPPPVDQQPLSICLAPNRRRAPAPSLSSEWASLMSDL
jgi:hypothetical protein